MPRTTTPSRPQSLIATKTIAAQYDQRFASRVALLDDFLSERGDGAVASIVATAGSGKSVLMAELHGVLRARGTKTCWLNLEGDDDSEAVVAAYLVSALHAVEPSWVSHDLALIRSNAPSDIANVMDRLVSTLSSITTPLTLFFDDFHHLHHPKVLGFFNKLANHLPPSMRLVISSRTQLPLALGRLRLHGRLFEVGQGALSFDIHTTDHLLRHLHGLTLDASDLHALQTTTEGWASGVQLAALALRRHQGPPRKLIDSFSGRDKDLAGYLVENVLRSQPPEVSDFLLLTAPLRRFCAPLCDAVTGQASTAAMLHHLDRHNLFLVPLDTAGRWFRYHHLFAECLTDELRRSDPLRIKGVWTRAARWCEDSGHTTEAIQYHLDSEDFQQASRLISEHALALAHYEGDHYTVLDWMRRLPVAYRERQPEILLSHAWSMAFAQNSYRAMELCNRVESLLRDDDGGHWSPAKKASLRLTAQVTQAVAEASFDQIDTSIARASELSSRIPPTEGLLSAANSICLSYCHLAKGDFDRSASLAAEAYLSGHRVGADLATAWADFLHGVADVGRGRLNSAWDHSSRLSAKVDQRGVAQSYSTGLAKLLAAEVLRQRCAFDDASMQLEKARFFSGFFGAHEPLLLAIRNEAVVLARTGRGDEARHTLMNGQDLALRLNLRRLFTGLAIDEVVLRLHADDTVGALESVHRTRLLDSPSHDAASGTDTLSTRSLQLLRARLQLAQGDATGALRELNLLQNGLGADRCSGLALSVTALKAIALWHTAQHKEAMREFDRALAQGAAERHAFPILDAGPGLLPILQARNERRQETLGSDELMAKDQLCQRLTALLTGAPAVETTPSAHRPQACGPLDPVTEREAQLLRLVDAGLGNKQLAEALHISEGTVKWHLHNVYAKLGVRSRSAATAKARALRLI